MTPKELVSDQQWIERCVGRLIELDPSLEREFALPVAEDMCIRQRWRDMGPEAAAQAVFNIGCDRPGQRSLSDEADAVPSQL